MPLTPEPVEGVRVAMSTCTTIRDSKPAHRLSPDLTGRPFGLLMVETYAGRITTVYENRTAVQRIWLCRCQCGGTIERTTSQLHSGHHLSCGCADRSHGGNYRHQMTGTRIYKIWCQLVQRCTNENHPNYHLYGGRGIELCRRWRKFEHFYADMGDGASGLSLERKNNDKGYSPENCKWATTAEQNRNKRDNRFLTFRGRTQCIKDWAKEIGLTDKGLAHRIDAGWSVEEALTTLKVRQLTPEERALRQWARLEFKRGKCVGLVIIRDKCELCGRPDPQAHHSDYSFPLRVRWLCNKCHRGAAGPSDERSLPA